MQGVQVGRCSANTAAGSANGHALLVWWLGIKEVDEGIGLVSFMHHDPGYIDLEQKTPQTLDNPFGRSCHACLQCAPSPMCPGLTL